MGRRVEWTILLSYFVVLLCLEAGNPFLPLYLKSMVQVDPKQLAKLSAMVLSAPLVGLVLFAPVWGYLADNVGRKKMLIRANIALSLTQLLIALSYTPEMLITTRFCQGVFSGFISAMQIYALHVCLPSKKGLMLSRLQGAQASATALGGVIGGVILSFLPYRAIYYLAAIVTTCTTLVIWRYLPRDSCAAPRKEKEAKTNLSALMVIVMLLIFLSQLAKFIPHSIFAFYASTITSHTPLLIGLLYAAPGISIIFSMEASGRLLDRLREANQQDQGSCFSYFTLLGLFAATVLMIQSTTHNMIVVFICRLLWGLVLGALLPGLYVMITEIGHARGYLLGLANSITKCGNLSGIYLGAFASGWLPYEQLFLLMACVYTLLAFVSGLTLMREKRKRVVL